MTPANVREFLDRVQPIADAAPPPGQRIHLHESEGSYEGIVRDFLRRALEQPPEQAVVLLWLYCLELLSASVVELEEERLARLFEPLAAGEVES